MNALAVLYGAYGAKQISYSKIFSPVPVYCAYCPVYWFYLVQLMVKKFTSPLNVNYMMVDSLSTSVADRVELH